VSSIDKFRTRSSARRIRGTNGFCEVSLAARRDKSRSLIPANEIPLTSPEALAKGFHSGDARAGSDSRGNDQRGLRRLETHVREDRDRACHSREERRSAIAASKIAHAGIPIRRMRRTVALFSETRVSRSSSSLLLRCSFSHRMRRRRSLTFDFACLLNPRAADRRLWESILNSRGRMSLSNARAWKRDYLSIAFSQ